MKVDIAALFEIPEEDLWEQLGSEIQSDVFGARSHSSEEKREYAKTWLTQKRKELAELICKNSRIISLRKSKRAEDKAQLVAAIVDLITSIVTGLAAATLAVLLVKEGLIYLCGPIEIGHSQSQDASKT